MPSVVLDALTGALKPHGFTRRGKIFRRRVADVVQVVQLQSSMTSTHDRLKATVNVGVYSVKLEERLRATGWAWKQTDVPAESDCHWRVRLGRLMPAWDDVWWTVTSPGEAHAAAEEIAVAVSTYALPVLANLASTESLEALWSRGFDGHLPLNLSVAVRLRYLSLLSRTTDQSPV